MPLTKRKKNYSKSKREAVLSAAYDKNERKINKVLKFLIKNKRYRKNYTLNYLGTILSKSPRAKQKLLILYLNAINAAGGNNLTLTGEAAKKFYRIVDNLPNRKQIDLKMFFSAISDKLNLTDAIQNFSDFHEQLVGTKYFANFGQKKIALFIRDVHACQSNDRLKIFTKCHICKEELIIPVDVVICDVLNKMLGLRRGKALSAMRDFTLINVYFKKKWGSNYMLLEDLWFWGYFNSVKTNGNSTRKVSFNEDKYYSDKLMYPNRDMKNKLERFGPWFNNLFLLKT